MWMAQWNMSRFTDPTDKKIKRLTEENKRYVEALTLIRDVAEVSEGVDWYRFIAAQAIDIHGEKL